KYLRAFDTSPAAPPVIVEDQRMRDCNADDNNRAQMSKFQSFTVQVTENTCNQSARIAWLCSQRDGAYVAWQTPAYNRWADPGCRGCGKQSHGDGVFNGWRTAWSVTGLR